MGQFRPRSCVQTERRDVCAYDRGQDSLIQIRLSLVNKMFINSFNANGLY